ncbi:MAG: DsbA family protein, partial [Steroidobacteraceae bacterium]
TQATADEVLHHLTAIALFNPMDYIRIGENGDPFIDLSNLSREQALVLKDSRSMTTRRAGMKTPGKFGHDGRDVGDQTVLIEVGASAGLDPAMILNMLASNQGEAEVAAELQRARGINVSGVPTVLVDGWPIFSGAIRSELMQAHLGTAASHGQG